MLSKLNQVKRHLLKEVEQQFRMCHNVFKEIEFSYANDAACIRKCYVIAIIFLDWT